MRKILLLIICLSGLTVSGQNIGGIINDYTAVTSMNQNVFDVTTTTNFNVGDKVMVIKMKGASINQTNSPSYGDTINTNQAGLYIFSKVIAKTATNLTLSPYCSLFTNSDYLQIVRIPQYSNATVIAPSINRLTSSLSASISAARWARLAAPITSTRPADL